MKHILYLTLLIILCVSALDCNIFETSNDEKGWLEELIIKFQNEPIGNPPQSIWQYEYKGEIVYYIPPQCCDQYSTLYNSEGEIICAPDGGLTGGGDGHCPDFFNERKNERLIWQDPRKH